MLEIEVEGGFQIWTSAKRYREDVLLLKPDAKVGDAVSVDTLPRVSERGVNGMGGKQAARPAIEEGQDREIAR